MVNVNVHAIAHVLGTPMDVCVNACVGGVHVCCKKENIKFWKNPLFPAPESQDVNKQTHTPAATA